MQIYEVIVTDILNKRYKYGDLLPSLNTLCKEFNAGRNTIRSVMLLLEERGFIKSQRGRRAEVIFNINNACSKKLYETSIYERKTAYEEIYQLLISFMPELICELKNRTAAEKLDLLIEKVYKTYDRSHLPATEDEFTNQLYTITVEAISLLDNSLLDSLYLSIIRFIYLPVPINANKEPSFFNILNIATDSIPKIASFLLSTNQKMLKTSISILMQTFSKASLHYVNKIGKNIAYETYESIPFRWSSSRSLDLLYMSVVIQVIQDINNEKYHDYLPSLQEMADQYQVSIRTIRKATDMLNQYKIIQKTNGIKSRIIIKQIKDPKILYENQEVINNIILFKEAIQILFILIKALNKKSLSTYNNKEITNIINATDQSLKQVLETYIHLLISNSSNTVQAIYYELKKSLAWTIYSEQMFDFSIYHYDYNERKQNLIEALKKKNYQAINTYLDELYTLIEKEVNKVIDEYKLN